MKAKLNEQNKKQKANTPETKNNDNSIPNDLPHLYTFEICPLR